MQGVKRAIGVIVAFVVAGPPIGGVLGSLYLTVGAALAGNVTLQAVPGALFGMLLVALFSYVVAWLPALLAGVGTAVLVAVTSDWRWRYAGTLVIGFIASFGYMVLRPTSSSGANLWTEAGTYAFGVMGAGAAVGSLAIFHYVAALRAEQPT